MQSENKYDVLILVDSGIGNALEALYAVEYCLNREINVGFFMGTINKSFTEYIKDCYSDKVIVSSLKDVRTTNLIHSFTYQEKINLEYENYFYVSADYHSTQVLSETEQYLSIVRALYPSSYNSLTLNKLKEINSQEVEKLEVGQKYIFYPGGSAINPVRRWPYYIDLMNKLGKENVIFVGGTDDVDHSYSYFYPKYLTALLPQAIINNRSLWNFLKKTGILISHAEIDSLEKMPNAYINRFSWAELVAIFKKCKLFIGNDGGLTHLAAASGASGYVIFGPTSANKNKPYNSHIKPIKKSYSCQPCQFSVDKVCMTKYYISCPYQIKCLYDIPGQEIIEKMKENGAI